MNNSLYPKYYLFPYGDEDGGESGDTGEDTSGDTSGDTPGDTSGGAYVTGVPASSARYVSPVSVTTTGTVVGIVETSMGNGNVLRLTTPLRAIVPGTRVEGPGIPPNTTVVSVNHETNSYTLNQAVDTILDYTGISFVIPRGTL